MPWQKAGGFAYVPAPDPLWHRAPTPIEACYNVLGIPLRFTTNAPRLAELADEVFGDWGTPEPDTQTPAVRLQVLLHNVTETQSAALPLVCRAQEGYLLLNKGASQGFGDRPAGFAAAFVTPNLLEDPQTVRTCFLECLGLYLVCHHRSATLHAAAVAYNGRCVLLTGSNGTGKSTLAYACLRAGFQLLAEDIVFAEPTDTGVRVWGSPWNLHLLPDAVRFFPELWEAPCIDQMNGERKLRVSVRQMRPDAPVIQQQVWGVCSLNRSTQKAARLLAPDPTHIHHVLTHFKEDPLLNRPAMDAAADRLLQGRLAHLEIGTDPLQAAETLRHWIESDQ